MQACSMDEVQDIIDDLNSPLSGLVDRVQKIAILQAVAHEPGRAADEAVALTRQRF